MVAILLGAVLMIVQPASALQHGRMVLPPSKGRE
jgi:hypothetical protein